MGDFFVLTWSIFAGPVTYVLMYLLIRAYPYIWSAAK